METMLQFLIMVDSENDRAQLMQDLLRSFPEAEAHKAHSCRLRGNWLELLPNEDADRNLATDPADGYLHFAWELNVTPYRSDLDEDHQIVLARDLQRHFLTAGAKAVVGANFEDRL
ncbi:hypothetical protein BJY16_004286 [Actinoplanes octamycinicus]|uniref:Uncharacterized protein n=1 Tax=Actinoplanes octamycinicus TaxID=135948 RepID=A0A7W7GZ79_9ACTN|nr:hypothetical protein [Actinoplanes octamycinicus]MBB4740827.1 hypothetical protein [Actinoplanes octamycinicus]GIE55730.1 hypothetical protein Aoc01nite_11320 [Actinoplanes octamycinicus]